MLVLPRTKDQKLVIIDPSNQPLAVVTAVQVRHPHGDWEMRIGIDCSKSLLIQREENLPYGYVDQATGSWASERTTPQMQLNHSIVLAAIIRQTPEARREAKLADLKSRDPSMHALVLQQLKGN